MVVDVAAACLRPVVKALEKDIWVAFPTGSKVTVAQINERLTQYDIESDTDHGATYEAQISRLYASALEPVQTDSSEA